MHWQQHTSYLRNLPRKERQHNPQCKQHGRNRKLSDFISVHHRRFLSKNKKAPFSPYGKNDDLHGVNQSNIPMQSAAPYFGMNILHNSSALN